MLFKSQSPPTESEETASFSDSNEPFDFSKEYDDQDSFETSSSLQPNYKEKAFYWALQSKPLQVLLDELEKSIQTEIDSRSKSTEGKTALICKQIDEIELLIEEEKENFSKSDEFKEEAILTKKEHEDIILEQNNKLEEMISQLSDKHGTLIQDRLTGVQEELNSLVEMYDKVFQNKFDQESDYKQSIQRHRELCDQLKTKANFIFEKTSSILEETYRFSFANFSSSVLLFIGLMAVLSSGWFFSIFASQQEFALNNWINLSLTGVFNYIVLFIEQNGQIDAFKIIATSLLGCFVLLTICFYLYSILQQKLSNRKQGLHLDLFTNKKGSTTFLNLEKSFVSVWLKISFALLGVSILFIGIIIGLYSPSDSNQYLRFSQQISGQIIGSSIALLAAGIYYLYILKVVEPNSKNEDRSTSIKRGKNREVLIAVIGGNMLLTVGIITYFALSTTNDSKSIFAAILFLVLTNLTAFILAYSIRQKGLLRARNDASEQLLYLSNYQKAFSSNKPIHLWLRENQQFANRFLAIQNEIFAEFKL